MIRRLSHVSWFVLTVSLYCLSYSLPGEIVAVCLLLASLQLLRIRVDWQGW